MHLNPLILAFAAVLAHLSAVPAVLSAKLLTLERAFPFNDSLHLDSVRARDRVRHARMLQGGGGGGGAVVDFNVAGTSDPFLIGLYFTKVKLGSPPKVFTVQIDTGSDVLWVNCASCTDCPPSSGLGIDLSFFDTASSSSASLVSCSHPLCSSAAQTMTTQCSSQSNQCSYSFQYGDGSGTSGYYVSDTFFFDTVLESNVVANSSANVIFGCSTYQSGDLTKTDRAIDGIFGFGQHDLSIVSQLSRLGVTPKVFSHCLRGDSNGGGILVLGEILDPGIVYTPLVPSQTHYNLNLLSIAVNGQTLQINPAVFSTENNRGTIVDSGTTLTYLAEEAYDPFVSAVTSLVSQSVTPVISKGNQCYQVSTSVAEAFPPVSLNFAGDASMVLKPEEYLIHNGFVDSAAMWCIGFQKVQSGAITILGDLVLKDKIFVYDLVRQRVGWASYDCSTSVNVSVTTGKDEFVSAGQLSVNSSSRNLVHTSATFSILFIGLLMLHTLVFRF